MRYWKRVVATIAAVAATAVVYTVMLAYPEALFRYSRTRGPFVVHSRLPIDSRIDVYLDSAAARLVPSPLYRPGYRHRVFIAGSARWYAVFTGPGRRAMAKNFELGNSIFVPQLDATAGLVRHFDGRAEPAAAILAHEAMHTFVQRAAGGVLRLWRLPMWQKEGYAEYVAYGDSLALPTGLDALGAARAGTVLRTSQTRIPASYLEAELIWRLLLEKRGWSPSDVLRRPIPLDTARGWLHAYSGDSSGIPKGRPIR